MSVELIEIPVTRLARVTRLGTITFTARSASVHYTGDERLKPGDRIALKPAGGGFRLGTGRVLDDGRLDLRGIAAAADEDHLYRVEPP